MRSVQIIGFTCCAAVIIGMSILHLVDPDRTMKARFLHAVNISVFFCIWAVGMYYLAP